MNFKQKLSSVQITYGSVKGSGQEPVRSDLTEVTGEIQLFRLRKAPSFQNYQQVMIKYNN